MARRPPPSLAPTEYRMPLESLSPAPKPRRRGLTIGGTVVALALVVVVVNGVVDRKSSAARLKEATEAQALSTVSLVTPSTASNTSRLDLPGRLEAYNRAPIY